MRGSYQPGRWIAFRYDLEKRREPSGPLAAGYGNLLDRMGAEGRRQDQPFLIGPDGRADIRVNEFFASRRMLARSPLTWKKYAHTLALWLNVLLVLGRCWDSATEDDAEYFKEWRLTDESNPRPVDGATFLRRLGGASLLLQVGGAAARDC